MRVGPGCRRTAASTAAVFALTYFGALHHHAVVEHERCEEHGELVHVHHGAEADDLPSTRGGDEREKDGFYAADPDQGGAHGDHHHCQIHWTTRCSAPAGCERASVAIAPLAKLHSAIDRVEPTPAEPLFELAPKTSPPAGS